MSQKYRHGHSGDMNRPGLHVSWEDGRTVAAVSAITVTYEGRKFAA